MLTLNYEIQSCQRIPCNVSKRHPVCRVRVVAAAAAAAMVAREVADLLAYLLPQLRR